jgi:hypothetical protein
MSRQVGNEIHLSFSLTNGVTYPLARSRWLSKMAKNYALQRMQNAKSSGKLEIQPEET